MTTTRSTHRSFFGLLAWLFVAGCGSVDARTSMAPPVTTHVSAAEPPPPAAGDESARLALAKPSLRERPGLATEWGETRDCRIEEVPFARADEESPMATAEVRYDDERGVRSLASYVAPRAERAHTSWVAGGAVAVWLKDEHDNPLDFVEVGGRTFVIGESGERYTIVLENRTAHRMEVVSSVDGLDVMSGQPASVRRRGYLLLPYETLEIDGFRESESTVASFRFGRVSDSYAARQGSARDVGVIGLALFSERGDPWSPSRRDEDERRLSATPFPGDRRFASPPR